MLVRKNSISYMATGLKTDCGSPIPAGGGFDNLLLSTSLLQVYLEFYYLVALHEETKDFRSRKKKFSLTEVAGLSCVKLYVTSQANTFYISSILLIRSCFNTKGVSRGRVAGKTNYFANFSAMRPPLHESKYVETLLLNC